GLRPPRLHRSRNRRRQATRTRRRAVLPLLGRRRDTPCRRAGPAKTLAQTRERPAETDSTRLRASASCCRGYLLGRRFCPATASSPPRRSLAGS
ncbi:unnamed protein product, partial [Ascophyllum nodosum]